MRGASAFDELFYRFCELFLIGRDGNNRRGLAHQEI